MKILQLIEAAATGAGRHVIELTQGLLARGHEVHVLYSDLRKDPMFDRALITLGDHPRFFARRVIMQRKPSWRDVSSVCQIRRHMCAEGPFDIIHCQSTKAGLIGRVGLIGIPVKSLYTPHGFFSSDPTRGRILRRAVCGLELVLSLLCDGLVIVSREERQYAIDVGISPDRLHLIPNGITLDSSSLSEPQRIAIRSGWGLSEDEVCIGFVGRLTSVKSPETMLRAFAEARTTTKARLVIIGDGPQSAELRILSRELRIEGNVIWLGWREARSLMGAFDLFALTSESEGHPLVVLEAMAAGLPIVATDVGGISGTVHHGLNGFIAPVRGVAEIAAALEKLIENRGLRQRMGSASLNISKRFSADRMVDQTVELYQRIIAGVRTPLAHGELTFPALR